MPVRCRRACRGGGRPAYGQRRSRGPAGPRSAATGVLHLGPFGRAPRDGAGVVTHLVRNSGRTRMPVSPRHRSSGESPPNRRTSAAYAARVLRLYDTATGEVRELALRQPGQVDIYLCGPTVYGPPHLGHGRATLAYDVLRRYLEWSGLRRPAGVEHHRHRRQDHRPRPARGPGRGRDRHPLRGSVVPGHGGHRRRSADRHPPRHRLRRARWWR